MFIIPNFLEIDSSWVAKGMQLLTEFKEVSYFPVFSGISIFFLLSSSLSLYTVD